MKKLKNEAALIKEAMLAGVEYAEGRGVVQFEATVRRVRNYSTFIACWCMI